MNTHMNGNPHGSVLCDQNNQGGSAGVALPPNFCYNKKVPAFSVSQTYYQ